MQRHRFYAPPAQFSNSTIMLDQEEAHHLARVLRLPARARVYAFDGLGGEYECEIAQVGKQSAALTILRQLADEVESPLQLTLAQGLCKGEKFDWVIQKTAELGVTRVIPLSTEHSDVRQIAERIEQKLQRWRRIALEAVKQCGRRRLVEIAAPLSWQAFCEQDKSELRLIFAERGGMKLAELTGKNGAVASIAAAVAAEGGWSERELQLAEAQHFLPVQLGARILRTETAAVSAVALLQHRFGDLG